MEIKTEKWLPIAGYLNYQVSNFGQIRNTETNKNKKLIINRCGYFQTQLWVKGQQKTYLVHRLVANAFVLNTCDKPQVNHLDGNKLNNNVDNLEWSTPSENLIHAYKTNLISTKGSKNSRAKLTESDIPIIRNLLQNKRSIKEISLRFGVNISAINGVKYNKTWSHVE